MEFFNLSFLLLTVSTSFILFLLWYILRKKPITQMQEIFFAVLCCVLLICVGVIIQDICSSIFDINPAYFENFIYIGTCFFPIVLFFMALTFKNTKVQFKTKYIFLFIIPVLTLLILWTNNYHHLFYEHYSSNLNEMVYGSYFYIHSVYTYSLLIISMLIVVYASIKNSGFFSKQSILILIGTLIPTVINVCGTLKILEISVYLTPISFSVTFIFYALAIFKFQFLTSTPIALEKIVDRISDCYMVLSDSSQVIDFNKPFLKTFNISANEIRNINIITFLQKHSEFKVNINTFKDCIEQVHYSNKTFIYYIYLDNIDKYFTVEINSIVSKNSFLGILILFKDTTQHMLDLNQIKDNQDKLMEKERLASLGQLIGGIAHNLKTPIMSIAGATEGLSDLIKEYDTYIEDPEVTYKDHHDIAKEMSDWLQKIKIHTSYMSDVITAVKGQAISLSNNDIISFTVEELIKQVDILMKHELKNALVDLNVSIKVDSKLQLHGNINSLVQVINNMISNSIQSYNGKSNNKIDLVIERKNSNLIISIKDYGSGLPKSVKEKLFKEMVTTKGKNGTGLGLFMSYSNIRAHFNGNITVTSKEGKGSTFNIILPLDKE